MKREPWSLTDACTVSLGIGVLDRQELALLYGLYSIQTLDAFKLIVNRLQSPELENFTFNGKFVNRFCSLNLMNITYKNGEVESVITYEAMLKCPITDDIPVCEFDIKGIIYFFEELLKGTSLEDILKRAKWTNYK